ncbi:hypothetical protein [Microbispora sp. CA-102843]|uniref:hypothetical protein n=1 Tax=Microbispora sp. CA-102843 TaxID=3239952 RepID=UPI003D9221A9
MPAARCGTAPDPPGIGAAGPRPVASPAHASWRSVSIAASFRASGDPTRRTVAR